VRSEIFNTECIRKPFVGRALPGPAGSSQRSHSGIWGGSHGRARGKKGGEMEGRGNREKREDEERERDKVALLFPTSSPG